MNLSEAIRKAHEKGAKQTVTYVLKRSLKKIGLLEGDDDNKSVKVTAGKMYQVLLLTNRDSDNVGDQIIEASDIAILSAIATNLNKNFKINSRAASMITQKYLGTKDPQDLLSAEALIKDCDIVIFGGAPLFNFLYQNFYERTAVTLELAQKYNKPVIFSAVGIEDYAETNEKCQRLKKTLNFDCVKQITTRDGIEFLEQYKEREDLVIGKVADPAVLCSSVFKNQVAEVKKFESRKIGIFILRSNGFTDNEIPFNRTDAAQFWKELVAELKSRKYDYELLTSGHFGDEAFLDYLIREYGMDADKCVFNINEPTALMRHIASYDAVVSCRLHPSIISYSLGIPAIGIVWNKKVNGFYESINYPDRIISTEGITAAAVADKLEAVMQEGVCKEEDFLVSVYHTLFDGIKNTLFADSEAQPYNYQEILENLPPYKGTSSKEREAKLRRKFRRAYRIYNERFDKNIRLQEKNRKLREENTQLREKAENLKKEVEALKGIDFQEK